MLLHMAEHDTMLCCKIWGRWQPARPAKACTAVDKAAHGLSDTSKQDLLCSGG